MDCVFCKIVSGEIASVKVYEDDKFLAFLDINPRNPGHILVITKQHFGTFPEMAEGEAAEYMRVISRVTKAVAKATKAEGINILNNSGTAAGGIVPHVHFHIIPRFREDGAKGLESVLQVKKMDNEYSQKMAENIKNNIKPEKKQSAAEKPQSLKQEPVKEVNKKTEPETDIFAGNEDLFEHGD